MASLGREFGLILCECLGLDPNDVCSATVYATPVDVLQIDVEVSFRPNTEQVEELASVLRKGGHTIHLHRHFEYPDPFQLGTKRRELVR